VAFRQPPARAFKAIIESEPAILIPLFCVPIAYFYRETCMDLRDAVLRPADFSHIVSLLPYFLSLSFDFRVLSGLAFVDIV
jgi:hypothetical protein